MPKMNLLSGVYDNASSSIQVSGTLMPVSLPAGDTELRDGQHVLVGVRPEDCSLADADSPVLTGEVTYIELAGKDCWVRVKSGDHTIRMILPSDTEIQQGEAVGIAFRSSRLHLFDADSGIRLPVGAGREEEGK